MSAIAPIVVKNASNDDVTLSPLRGAAGDRVPAEWRYDGSAALPIAMRTSLKLSSQDNGPKTARRLVADGVVPITQVDSQGQFSVVARVPIHMELTLPTNVPASSVTDAATVLLNAIASAPFKTAASSGYAPIGA